MPQMPPEAMAMMKARGMQDAGRAAHHHPDLHDPEQVNADKPPAISNREDVKLRHQGAQPSPTAMHTEITCHGRMEGIGQMQMSWRGNEHYEGTYSFKGSIGGRPQDMTTHYTGDFVKADCGSVKPYGPPAGGDSSPAGDPGFRFCGETTTGTI